MTKTQKCIFYLNLRSGKKIVGFISVELGQLAVCGNYRKNRKSEKRRNSIIKEGMNGVLNNLKI